MDWVGETRRCPLSTIAMRRFRDRRAAPYFRGSELPRLLTLVVMLGVLVLLMDWARDPNTWTFFAPNDNVAEGGGEDATKPRRPEVTDTAPPPKGPTDLDPLEQDAAREELAAVTDKLPLAPEEMPAYWRLMAWELRQSTAELRKRADKRVTFRELWQNPDKYRGKLVEVPLHLRRAIEVRDLADNELGLDHVYEVFGWNSESQPYWYWLVVPNLPPGMPQGESIYEEATFVGYFLKLLPYEDREGHTRATPLLIGRLVWHPAPSSTLARRDEWTWTGYLLAALLVLFVVRWGMVFFGRSRRKAAAESLESPADEHAVEAWLDGKSEVVLDAADAFDAEDDDEAAER